MKRPNSIMTCFIIIAFTTLVSCRQGGSKEKNEDSIGSPKTTITSEGSVIENGNATTAISTDVEKLGQLLDFKLYKSTKVKFKYTFINNSGQNQRFSVPGPSDYSLQALLYFDSSTFDKFLAYDRNADYPSPNYNKDEFKFDWLSKEILTELNSSKKNYYGHLNFFIGTVNAKLWYLDKKILIVKQTN